MTKMFSAAEAARETKVSRTTIQRMLRNGAFPQAEKSRNGWQIPLDDLLANGLVPGLYQSDQQPDRDHDQQSDQAMTNLAHEVELLRVRLHAAQSLADERARTIDEMRTTMRALEAARPTAQNLDDGPITKIARRFRL